MVFVLDNYDSFTYNLVQYMGELGAEMVVRRNDALSPAEVEALRPTHIVISPGPCTPEDAGISIELVRHFARLAREGGQRVPVLGVCLGHQAIGAAFGGNVVRAPRLMHGKTSEVEHDRRTIFAGIESPMTCTRYHSLIVADEGLPDELEVSARTVGGEASGGEGKSGRGGDDDHGAASSRAAHRGRAVPSGERIDRAWQEDHRELPEDVGWTHEAANSIRARFPVAAPGRLLAGWAGARAAVDRLRQYARCGGCRREGRGGGPRRADGVGERDGQGPHRAHQPQPRRDGARLPDQPAAPGESREMMVAAPLLFSLDSGAIEIQTTATPTDAVMTPDLRFTARTGGPLDLRLRVARNGDTCVENRGAGAPVLEVSDPFGDAVYELAAGQHVLFEHGSLREVVDHESSLCGCPDEKGVPVADALMAPATAAAVQHPFPVAISEGLAPEAEVPQAPTGEVHAQVSETLSYNAPPSAQAGSGAEAGAPSSAATAQAPPVNDLAHIVGRFFHKLFRRG